MKQILLVLMLGVLALSLGACASAPEEDVEATEETGEAAAASETAGAPAPTPPRSAAPTAPAPRAPAPAAPAQPRDQKATEPAEPPPVSAEAEGSAVPPGMVVVPAGTQLNVKLLDSLSTKETVAGTPFTADMRGPTYVGDKKVPTGRWIFVGEVSAVVKPKKKKDMPGELALDFHTIQSKEGAEYPAEAYVSEFAGETKKRNIGVIVGTAVAGAVVGKKAGGDSEDALIGAAVGAAAGAGIVRALPGKHLELSAGSELVVTLVSDTVLPYVEE
jgi:hypothetical protein